MTNDIKLIAIGGSAGSLQVVLKIFDYLDSNYSIPILLVLHRNINYPSSLEELLLHRTKLISKEVEEKEKIKPGCIYICPADYHVLVEDDQTFSLDVSEKVNFSRPSIDVVFKSASEVYKDQMVGMLLSGANADGADGLLFAKRNKSITVVQDPNEAEVPYMPQQAIKHSKPDHILNTNEMAGFLNSLFVK